MTSLFKRRRLSDIALRDIAVQIVLGITEPEHVSGRIHAPFDTMLEELLEDYDSYKDRHGSLALICRLYNKTQDNHKQTFYWKIIEPELMKPVRHLNAFVTACEYGNFLTAQWLYELATIQLKKFMLETHGFGAFRNACANGHQPIATWLYELATPEQKKGMLEAGEFYGTRFAPFRLACQNGNQQIATWLYELATQEQKIDMFEDDDFGAFRLACEHGQQQTATWLYDDLATTEQHKTAMLEADNFDAFRGACANGHQPIATWLYELATTEQKS